MHVTIHAGAHFTDDGRLIKGLQANAGVIGQNNGVAWGPRRYRQIFASALNAPSRADTDAETLSRFESLIPAGRPVDRAILSCDAFIGERMSVIDDGQFYPLAGHRMAHLDHLLQDMTVELFVGLHNPGSFIPKVLMGLPEQDRQNILRTTDLSCLSWLSMIEDIRELAPNVKLTLWSNEDSPLIWGDMMRAVAGLPDDTPLIKEYEFLSSLLSDIGKHQVQKLVEQEPMPRSDAFYDTLVSIFQKHALPDAIEEEVQLPGWSDDIVDAFTELYEQDLTRLQTMSDIRFLKP